MQNPRHIEFQVYNCLQNWFKITGELEIYDPLQKMVDPDSQSEIEIERDYL